MTSRSLRLFAAMIVAALSLALPAMVHADVDVTFYSHELGENFPHAFIVAKGSVGAGDKVDAAYGFTAKNVSPAILWGSVIGIVKAPPPKYIAQSNAHFTVTLDDASWARMMRKIVEWRDRPQKSYNLNKRNCTHFVLELAETAGLKVNRKTEYIKKPRSFLEEVERLNPRLK